MLQNLTRQWLGLAISLVLDEQRLGFMGATISLMKNGYSKMKKQKLLCSIV